MVTTSGRCCSKLSVDRRNEVVTTPSVVLRGVFAGWIVTTTGDVPKTRAFQTWEIRIDLAGRVQETRGWQSADGFLPPSHISTADAARFYELAQSLSDLPDFVGRIATDVPYRQIEYVAAGKTRTISGYEPADRSDDHAHRFDEVWNEIVRHFRERQVCQP